MVVGHDTLKEIRQEFSAVRSGYHELNKLRQQLKTQEAKCKKEVENIRTKIQELDDNSRDKNEEFEILQGLTEIESVFMKLPTLFLRLIIGDISVTLPYKEDREKYKAEYEKFKMFLSVLLGILTVSSLTIFRDSGFLDGLLPCMGVGFYLIITLRELVLISNGSNMSWWWIIHHLCSIAVSGLVLVMPPGDCYNAFKNPLTLFTTFLCFMNTLQCRYQLAKIYRTETKITIKNLLLGIVGVYVFQLYNAYTLYKLYQSTDIDCDHWQVPLLSLLFLILAVMNSATLFIALYLKRSLKRNKHKSL